MAVTLYVTESLANSNPNTPTEFADALAGGGTGIDLGQVVNGQFGPIVNQSTNDGAQVVYLSHDAEIDPITNLKVYLGQFSQTYGGANTAAGDYTALKAEGNTSTAGSGDKNNGNGTASGIWVDFDWDVSQTNQFDIFTRSSLVKIFGDNTTDGIDEASAYSFPTDAFLYTSDGIAETAPSAAQAGKIGTSNADTTGVGGDSVLGNRAKVRIRSYLRTAFADGGIYQADLVFRFSYTA